MYQNIITAVAIVLASAMDPCIAQPKKQNDNVDLRTKASQPYRDMISPGQLSAKLHYLASDYFHGRSTGTEGCKNAARYLAVAYKTMGLQPIGNPNAKDPLTAFLQEFPYERGNEHG